MAARTFAVWAGVAAAVGLAGCGDGEPPTPRSGSNAARVVIALDADGDGPRPVRRVRLGCPAATHREACRALLETPRRVFDDTPGSRACTQIYGGPQRGRIEGRIGDRGVDAHLSRANGCEIERWDRLAPVLDVAAR